jgi:hypothetical protein
VNTHEAILCPTLKLRLQPNNARRLPIQPLGLMTGNYVEQVFFGILHRFLQGRPLYEWNYAISKYQSNKSARD